MFVSAGLGCPAAVDAANVHVEMIRMRQLCLEKEVLIVNY